MCSRSTNKSKAALTTDQATYRIGPVVLCLKEGRGFLWVGPWGVKWKDTRTHALLFSDRNGYDTGVQIGHYYISTLPK